MKTIITALALLTFGWTSQANAFAWQHFGAAKFAITREEGIAHRMEAFQCMGIEPSALKVIMNATSQAGTPVTITNGQHYDKMVSKGCRVDNDVSVAWVKPPVNNMQYATPGEEWRVQVGNVLYILTRPDICNNWLLVKKVTIVPLKTVASMPECPTIEVPVGNLPAGAVKGRVTFEVAGPHDLAPSKCVMPGHPCQKCVFVTAEHDAGQVFASHDIRAFVFLPGPKFVLVYVSPEVKTGGYHFKVCAHALMSDGSVWASTQSYDVAFDDNPQAHHFWVPAFDYRPQ